MKALEPGHSYLVDSFEGGKPQAIYFINKFNGGTVHDGTTNEELLKVLIDRLQFFQTLKFSCRENAIAITKLQEALMWLEHRTRLRQEQGVEGQDLPHTSI